MIMTKSVHLIKIYTKNFWAKENDLKFEFTTDLDD